MFTGIDTRRPIKIQFLYRRHREVETYSSKTVKKMALVILADLQCEKKDVLVGADKR